MNGNIGLLGIDWIELFTDRPLNNARWKKEKTTMDPI